MAFGIAFEEFLVSEVSLPIQFQRIWHGSTTTTSETTLAMSVLLFLNLCEALRLSPSGVRVELLGDPLFDRSSRRREPSRRTSRALRLGSLWRLPCTRYPKSASRENR
jgi:hypothetical protein